MNKEQITIRVKPSVKTILLKRADDKIFKNLNDYISNILENHTLNIKEENKINEKLSSIQQDTDDIRITFEKLITILEQKKII
ncbi:MAG TPA: hypothetical protein PL131_09490 [Methylotenera sp.]|nr:hypothetical protein [Methylotenera sp.]HPH06095.1 hypothetical protein [Methylotenera sp.]